MIGIYVTSMYLDLSLYLKTVGYCHNFFHYYVHCWFLLDQRPPLYVKITYLPAEGCVTVYFSSLSIQTETDVYY